MYIHIVYTSACDYRLSIVYTHIKLYKHIAAVDIWNIYKLLYLLVKSI